MVKNKRDPKKAKTVPLKAFQKLQKQFEDYQTESGEFIVELRKEHSEASGKHQTELFNAISAQNEARKRIEKYDRQLERQGRMVDVIIQQQSEINDLKYQLKEKGE